VGAGEGGAGVGVLLLMPRARPFSGVSGASATLPLMLLLAAPLLMPPLPTSAGELLFSAACLWATASFSCSIDRPFTCAIAQKQRVEGKGSARAFDDPPNAARAQRFRSTWRRCPGASENPPFNRRLYQALLFPHKPLIQQPRHFPSSLSTSRCRRHALTDGQIFIFSPGSNCNPAAPSSTVSRDAGLPGGTLRP
jgi:hypothetical protein